MTSYGQRVMQHGRYYPQIKSHSLSGLVATSLKKVYITYFICQVTSQDYAIEDSYDFVVGGPWFWAINLWSLVVIPWWRWKCFNLLWFVNPYCKTPSHVMFVCYGLCGKGGMLSICHMTSRNHMTSSRDIRQPRDQRVTWLWGCWLFSRHPVKFCGCG